MDFQTLNRRQLQALCKKNKIPANQTNVAMAAALAALPTVEGLEEMSPGKGCGSVCVTATTASRASRAPIRQTPAKVKALDFAESVPNQTPAPVPASRRRGVAGVKGGETATNSVLGTRRSTRLAAKSASRGSEATAPKKMEFDEITESFGEISLDEKSEAALPVDESGLSADNAPKVVDETKNDELDTITVDASAENVVESKQDAVSQIGAKNADALDEVVDEQVINEKEVQSVTADASAESVVEKVADVVESKEDAVCQIEAKNVDVLDEIDDEQIINEKEIQSVENVDLKESSVGAVDDDFIDMFHETVEEMNGVLSNLKSKLSNKKEVQKMEESNVQAMADADVNVLVKAVGGLYVDFSPYQTETTEEQVTDGGEKEFLTGEQVEKDVDVDENKDQSSDSASNVESDDDIITEEQEKDAAATTETTVDTGITTSATREVLGAETETVEAEGSIVEAMSDVDDSEAESYDSEEDESYSEAETESVENEDLIVDDMTDVDDSDAESDDLTEEGDSEDDTETTLDSNVVVALKAPSAAEVLAEKLDSIELKDDVMEKDTAMEDSTVLEMENNKPKEEEGLNNNTSMEMKFEKPDAASSYMSPVKAPAAQYQMSVSKTPTSGKRMSVRFADNDKENSMIESIGAKLMMLTSPAKEGTEKKESQKPSNNVAGKSLRQLKKEYKELMAEKAARPALQTLSENCN